MAGEGYELLAMFMRYVFVALGALILWRAYRWMRKDARNYKREMRRLPDAGLIGEIVNLRTGQSQPLPREGILGASSACDVHIKGVGIARKHALFSFVEGKGVLVTPCGRKKVLMENVEISGPTYALHGTQLQLGDSVLRVRLFAGLNVPHPTAFMPDAQEENFWEGPESASPFDALPVFEAPPSFESDAFPQMPAYSGQYTEDGQMTWNYAYSLDELQQAQQAQQVQTTGRMQFPVQNPFSQENTEEIDEAMPYQSPVPRHRRRERS